ncbi:60Kd inner membrane protein-domain-containing protein [Pelagophyceae sp. CCMP2097]|nr:60Kd inner membrane protein-domain-containing protein [Pelagophyceae sp. CCMP2097]
MGPRPMARVTAAACLAYACALVPPAARLPRRARVAPLKMVDTTFLEAAISGATCVDDASWWCVVQGGVQGTIVSLHGVVRDTLHVEDNSYGASIILFTAFCRAAIFPLNYVSYAAAEKTKALKPFQDKIKTRYGEDQQAVNIATAKLYELSGTNPLAGCLPSIAQIPVFIALYRSVLNLAFEGELNEPFFWLPSLEGPTYASQRGIGWLTDNWVSGVPSLGWHDTAAFLVLPIALIVTQSISMSVLQPPPDPNDKAAMRANRVLKYLPLMIGWFAANVPAGLGLYWMTSNVLSVVSTKAAKGYLAANPPKVEVNLRELGLDDESAGVKLPATIEEAIMEAKLNARPNRTPRRPGIAPLALFDAQETEANVAAVKRLEGVSR